MSQRKVSAPLTPASEARLSRAAKTMLATAAQRTYLPMDLVAQAAGLLLRIARHTGETATAVTTRLRIPESHRYLIVRAGQRQEQYKGEPPLPVFKRFREINKTKPGCTKGKFCHCPREAMRVRCEHYWRVNPAQGELGNGAGRGALDARPVTPKKEKSCVRGDGCTCTKIRERVCCGNWRGDDPAIFDFRPGGEPWYGDDHAG